MNYFETTFTAVAGVPYHLWLRLKAQGNRLDSNSVSVQFDDALDQFGSPLYQINTATGAEVVLAGSVGVAIELGLGGQRLPGRGPDDGLFPDDRHAPDSHSAAV